MGCNLINTPGIAIAITKKRVVFALPKACKIFTGQGPLARQRTDVVRNYYLFCSGRPFGSFFAKTRIKEHFVFDKGKPRATWGRKATDP